MATSATESNLVSLELKNTRFREAGNLQAFLACPYSRKEPVDSIRKAPHDHRACHILPG